MQKKCRFENKLVKPENWTGQEFTFSPTVQRGGVQYKGLKNHLKSCLLDISLASYEFKTQNCCHLISCRSAIVE
jgi:hypothetical protein